MTGPRPKYLAAVALAALGFQSRGWSDPARLAGALATADPPTIDGRLDEACWKTADVADGFTLLDEATRPASKATAVRVCYDAASLYIGAILGEPNVGALSAKVTKRDGDVWADDSLEILLDVSNDHISFFQLVVNSLGTVWDGTKSKQGVDSREWNVNARVVVSREAGSWTLETAIPLSDLDPELLGYRLPADAVARDAGLRISSRNVIGINFCRNDIASGGERSSWSPTQGGFRSPEQFGHLVFGVSARGLADSETAQLTAAPPPAARRLEVNGSFERVVPGIRPEFPEGWRVLRGSRQDRIELVHDPANAHLGRRFLRLYPQTSRGMQVHSAYLADLQEGTNYVARLWARSAAGGKALLRVKRVAGVKGKDTIDPPAVGEAELASGWTEYAFSFRHQKSDPGGFLAVEVAGGTADLDDVSLVAGGADVPLPPELLADRGGLDLKPVLAPWRARAGEPAWNLRVPIAVSEVMGRPAADVPVSLELQRLLPGIGTVYPYVSADRLKVVDASRPGAPEVPSVLAIGPSRGGAPGEPPVQPADRVVFQATVEPRTGRTYFLYVAGFDPVKGDVRIAERLPQPLADARAYPFALDAEVGPLEHRVLVEAGVRDGRLLARVNARTARSVSATLIPPDRSGPSVELPLLQDPNDPQSWIVPASYRFPARDGVWMLQAAITDQSGAAETADTCFVSGSAMWAASAAAAIYGWSPPQFSAGSMTLSAARNEKRAFQAAVESASGLNDVVLTATALRHVRGAGVIPADRIGIDRIAELYLDSPPVCGTISYVDEDRYRIEPCRAGWYPDPLLPWRACNIPGGERRTAWITVDVPSDAAPGQYQGQIIAQCLGRALSMPVNLRVFDFSLPDRLAFTPVIGAEPVLGGEIPPREAVLATGEFLARRGMTPFYYRQAYAPYFAPWRYHPEDGTATFDFTEFDRWAGRLLDDLGVRYIFLIPEFRTGNTDDGFIVDGRGSTEQWPGWENQHSARNSAPLAFDMRRAWARAMGSHLKEKGWINGAYVYITDESYGPALEVTCQIAKALREGCPEMRTFAASEANGPWHSYFDLTSAFAGQVSPENEQRFAAQGIEHWGAYNRPLYYGFPLAISRIIGLDSWSRGYPVYFNYSGCADWFVDHWLNPQKAFGVYPLNGLETLIYRWPEDEPAPPGGAPMYVSSMRLEALRESIQDYEYMKMLQDAAGMSPSGSAIRQRYEALRDRVRKLLADGNLRGDFGHGVPERGIWVVSGFRLETLHREIGEALEAALSHYKYRMEVHVPKRQVLVKPVMRYSAAL